MSGKTSLPLLCTHDLGTRQNLHLCSCTHLLLLRHSVHGHERRHLTTPTGCARARAGGRSLRGPCVRCPHQLFLMLLQLLRAGVGWKVHLFVHLGGGELAEGTVHALLAIALLGLFQLLGYRRGVQGAVAFGGGLDGRFGMECSLHALLQLMCTGGERHKTIVGACISLLVCSLALTKRVVCGPALTG